ncbi:MAG: type III-B CRISPR module RAMP protein Cmr6 [Bacteroidia bacterium]
MMQNNIGWLFYKDFFANLQEVTLEEIKSAEKKLMLEEKRKNICNTALDKVFANEYFKVLGADGFVMKTTYPGFTTGLGINHSIGVEGEIKLGFAFDYTTGLPYLPASSVKGALRSAFWGQDAKRLEKLMLKEDKTEKEKKAQKRLEVIVENKQKYLLQIAQELKLNLNNNVQILALEEGVFGTSSEDNEDNIPRLDNAYKRDIFLDAYPCEVINGSLFLDIDYITPHIKKDEQGNVKAGSEFSQPIPIPFLKIRPNVKIQFQFLLQKTEIENIAIEPKDKLELFKLILINLGIGAKTRVGYGRLKPA